jgi:N-acetylneuraminic acid mutarotase
MRHNPATNIWTFKNNMPTSRYGVGAGVIGRTLYAVGGFDSSGTALNTVEAYNTATNTWTTKAPMPTARGKLGVGVIAGTLYAVGGNTSDNPRINGSPLSTVEAYDPTTNSWTTQP